MYKHLWSNIPKECFEFPDYTYDEHFGKTLPSHLPRPMILDYIGGRVVKSSIKEKIRFKTVVRWVSFNDDSKKFILVSENL